MDDSTITMIRAFIVDDHEMVRDGIRLLFEAHDDITVVGEAGDAAAAIGRIVVAEPDVVLLDINLPDQCGIEVCRELKDRCPSVHVLMLTSFDAEEAVFDSFLAGADGYILKHVGGTDLVDCVRKVARGESLIDHAAIEHLRDRAVRGELDGVIGRLTPQERRILTLLADGLTNRAIADAMFLSDRTVKNYVSSLLMKLGMSRRSEAAAYGARHDERQRAYARSATDRVPIRF